MPCNRALSWWLCVALLTLPLIVSAKEEYSLKQILDLAAAPEGVVIEIITGDNAGLDWALPRSQEYVKQLRRRFKDLPIAIVTHGREQFALTRKNQTAKSKEHQAVRSLLQDNYVQVHVCGTYAGWRGLSKEDFPDYVDVAAAAPAQINDYVALGYLRLVIRSKT